ncbi:substrate-binding domain-containing protein [Agromyces laixinhei]|uniref:substrate-binding domain-containing protein n=1 Tax=Agromyces laixinhei TaxID=2585717 RepID=UPI00111713B7|nr:substrate-binding domain-containing protein [Agromyces laixinhei]
MSRRSEREESRKRRRRTSRIVAATVAVVALVGGVGAVGTAWATGGLGEWMDPTAECVEPIELTVLTDRAIAATVQAVAAEYDASETACSHTEVVAQESADTAAVLASGNATDVDAWIPDSPVWLVRMASMARSLGRPVPDIALERSIATSPIVFAVPVSRAEEFAGRDLSWKGLLTDEFAAILPDPEASSASLNALQSLESRVDIAQPRQFQNAMIRLNAEVPANADAAFAALSVSDPGTVAIASEQQVALHNRKTGADPLLALYPSDGSLALSYPFLRLLDESELAKNLPGADEQAGDADPESAELARRARELGALKIALWEATARFAGDGFRDGLGGGELEQDGVVEDPVEVSSAAASAQVAILRTWGVVSVRSRILTVIDLSGSMEEPTVSGQRRIDVLQQAAAATLSQFSGQVDLGVWGFSTLRAGAQDWESLAPIDQLSSDAHRQLLNEVIASLPTRLGGATGLYDTTLAAVQSVLESYDPAKVNSVLLLTDGRNEDENGISGEQLLAELAALQDPERPVPVTLVGIGPDTDLESMRRIAEATGGAAYSAARPEDLTVVLNDALSQRACRPNC